MIDAMEQKSRFILEAITVEWDKPPQTTKTPKCPDRFIWRDETLPIVELLEEWRDYGRRGRMASNMRPTHAARARIRGSWGVGRFYFKVRVVDGRVFDIYYDRAPKSSDQRQGTWFLNREWF